MLHVLFQNVTFDKNYGLAYVEEIDVISAKYLSKLAIGDEGKFLYRVTVKDTGTVTSLGKKQQHCDGHSTFPFAAARRSRISRWLQLWEIQKILCLLLRLQYPSAMHEAIEKQNRENRTGMSNCNGILSLALSFTSRRGCNGQLSVRSIPTM